MRMRKRRNLAPRMERCAELLISEPEQMKGKWKDLLPGCGVLWLELGCGKGRFTAELAETEPQVLLVALERVPDAMIIAMERAKNRGLPNVRFIDGNASLLDTFFGAGEVDRIFINFCDPWPKSRDAKLRLTSPAFLRQYCDVLPVGGQICFKTDNTPLFDWSVSVFKDEKWQLSELTHDLHADGPLGIMTDYEAKFYAEGMKINRLVATKTAATLGTAAGPVARLKDASLTDARGYAESRAAFENRKEQE
ncbi:MAG: tRNA (guanosine(46)-N7)-methyltransferase TrmB [Oscillospiraceae bacterium]|nr:tRNA (guanosine(46)-N7)-methyltransferase TrmB [Oscillospiraceae bacterium]